MEAWRGGGDPSPSHLRPWRTSPHSISPQWSQKVGARYEWTNRQWGRIWKSSTVAEAVGHTRDWTSLDLPPQSELDPPSLDQPPQWGGEPLLGVNMEAGW